LQNRGESPGRLKKDETRRKKHLHLTLGGLVNHKLRTFIFGKKCTQESGKRRSTGDEEKQWRGKTVQLKFQSGGEDMAGGEGGTEPGGRILKRLPTTELICFE